MKKSKYEKPVARNLDAVQPVLGSCLSGNGEVDMTWCDPTGSLATGSCDPTGTTIIPFVPCAVGDSAGASCSTGNIAG